MEDFKGEETSPVILVMLFGKYTSPICVVVSQSTRTLANFLASISLDGIGGVLKIIDAYHLIDHCALREFFLTCQPPVSYILRLVRLPYSFFSDLVFV
jgi:hypothetical protein